MKTIDHTDWIVSIILILCSILLWTGWSQVHKEQLDSQMSYWEGRFEEAKEKREEKWERHCLVYSLGYANELRGFYDPSIPLAVYDNCVR